jgi:DNA mismatch repair protein MutS
MVEMNETALIMNNVSERSLILLDEIGRGTSTYDGISIAWSIAEYLHNNPKAQPKTLFATHYHELNELAQRHERIHNYHVSTRQVGQKVVFLRKLELGGSQHSFGIHVARMAGMPQEVIERANEILKHLESQHINETDEDDGSEKKAKTTISTKKKMQAAPAQIQLSIFESLDPYTVKIKEELLALDINALTPIDALWKINELRKIAAK